MEHPYFCLRNLVVMVRKLEVHPSSVDVGLLSKDIAAKEGGSGEGGRRGREGGQVHSKKVKCWPHPPGHDGALNVPSGPSLAPGAEPRWLAMFTGLPKCKVFGRSLPHRF